MIPAGTLEHCAATDSTTLGLFAAFDFFFSNEAFDLIIKQIENAQLKDVSLPHAIALGFHALFEPNEASKLLTEFSAHGSMRRLPDQLSRSLIFSDIKMIWDHNTRSFTSIGPLGVMIINGRQVNKYVNGKVEIIRRAQGDAFNIYIEPTPEQWFYFHYSAGVLHAVSSLDQFNAAITRLSDDRRSLPERKHEEPYRFVIGTVQMRNAFLMRNR